MGSPVGRELYADDLVIIAESLEESVRRLSTFFFSYLFWKEATEKKGLSKCRKDEDHDLWYGPGPHAELRRVSMRRLSHWSGQQQHRLQWLQALGAQEMHWLKRLTKDPDYRCARELHAPWTANHRGKSVGPYKLEG